MANAKISELPNDASLGGGEKIALADAGVSKSVNLTDLATFINSSVPTSTLANPIAVQVFGG